MNYATMLVHIDDSLKSDARVEFSAELSRKHNAHLVGMYVVCEDLLRPLFRPDESLDLATNEKQAAARQSRARAHFTETARRAGIASEWRAPGGPAADAAILHARHADLLVFGQRDPADPAAYIDSNFPDDVLLASGRPMILLPYAGNVERFGETILIAWDGGQAAARAIADALPLLRLAKFVEVAVVRQHADNAQPAGIELAAYLEQHKVQAAFRTLPRVPGVSTGATILNALTDTHSDLLIMGAYGHTRIRELVLGGVTRTMLESMTTPVLMSH